jgi:hypothetical protein
MCGPKSRRYTNVSGNLVANFKKRAFSVCLYKGQNVLLYQRFVNCAMAWRVLKNCSRGHMHRSQVLRLAGSSQCASQNSKWQVMKLECSKVGIKPAVFEVQVYTDPTALASPIHQPVLAL